MYRKIVRTLWRRCLVSRLLHLSYLKKHKYRGIQYIHYPRWNNIPWLIYLQKSTSWQSSSLLISVSQNPSLFLYKLSMFCKNELSLIDHIHFLPWPCRWWTHWPGSFPIVFDRFFTENQISSCNSIFFLTGIVINLPIAGKTIEKSFAIRLWS